MMLNQLEPFLFPSFQKFSRMRSCFNCFVPPFT
jgi:hypothetical protein